jgi:hypothetical protein
MAAVSCGADGADAGWIGGQPSIQPTPITSAAATAPETGATIQGETGGEAGGETASAGGSSTDDTGVASGAGAGSGPDGASAELFVSPDTTVASRSMVGPARFGRSEPGSDPVSSDLSSTITAVPLNGLVPELSRTGGELEHDPEMGAPIFR